MQQWEKKNKIYPVDELLLFASFILTKDQSWDVETSLHEK